jgi:hypothetical protein
MAGETKGRKESLVEEASSEGQDGVCGEQQKDDMEERPSSGMMSAEGWRTEERLEGQPGMWRNL